MSACTFPSGYLLSFANTIVGDELVTWTPGVRRATALDVRHNFWAPIASLDGTYPALVWEHNITAYLEKTTRPYYAEYLRNAAINMISSLAQPLKVMSLDTTTVVIAFGDCYCDGLEQSDPQSLLIEPAGILKFKFLGTSPFSIVSTF